MIPFNSFTIRTSRPSYMACLPHSTKCLHSVDKSNFLLVDQHWCVHMLQSSKVHPPFLVVPSTLPFFYSKWDGRQVSVQQLCCRNLHSRICSKQYAAYMCSSHGASYPSISLNFKWCYHTIVLTRLSCRLILWEFVLDIYLMNVRMRARVCARVCLCVSVYVYVFVCMWECVYVCGKEIFYRHNHILL